MRKTLFILTICLFSNLSFSQKIEKINGNTKFSCSQTGGLTETKKDYLLTVFYNSKQLKFNTSEKQQIVIYSITKKTDKYVIGKNEEENYAFYDISKKQFYHIDYYKKYIISGYGPDGMRIKQDVLKIMKILKNKKKQKDAIQYLINQTSYRF